MLLSEAHRVHRVGDAVDLGRDFARQGGGWFSGVGWSCLQQTQTARFCFFFFFSRRGQRFFFSAFSLRTAAGSRADDREEQNRPNKAAVLFVVHEGPEDQLRVFQEWRAAGVGPDVWEQENPELRARGPVWRLGR